MNAQPKTSLTITDREIILTRDFEAPRDLVWDAWTDPAHLSRWWGPTGFTTTTQSINIETGGEWRYTMHGPDGTDYHNHIKYLDVKRPERITYSLGGQVNGQSVTMQTTATFEAIGPGHQRTRITMRSLFPTREALEFVVRECGADEGGKQMFARFETFLESRTARSAPETSAYVITRVFHAPRDLVYQAWTQRDHLAKWFGPKGVSIAKCTLDLRVGGQFHFAFQMPDGGLMWNKWVFRDIVPSERLVFLVSFSNESGGITRAPFDPTWPAEMLSVVTFADHAGIGRGTVVTVNWTAHNASEIEQQAFDNGHAMMGGGWSSTLDELAEFLASKQIA